VWHAIVVVSIMLVSRMIATIMLLPMAVRVGANPIIIPYNVESDGGSSSATIGQVETEETFVEVAVALGATSSAGVNNADTDCTNDSTFRYKGKPQKNCRWVNKKPRKRCQKTQPETGELVAERCRKNCDYHYCKTIRDSQTKLLVGAYYYPWWGKDFHQGNPNNPQSYLRKQLLDSPQLPKLGEYDDTQPNILKKHLTWSRQNNIKLWVTSWWGKDRREDLNIKNNILKHPQLKQHKIAIFYETTGRIREKDGYALDNVQPDLEYVCQEYFQHPNYYTVGVDADGNADATSPTRRHVLFVYLTRKLATLGLLPEVLVRMRAGAREAGCGEIFIVGDHVFQKPPTVDKNGQIPAAELIPFDLLDAVTNYDVFGSMRGEKNGGYVGTRQKVTDYYQEQNQWKAIANNHSCAFIPAISAGYNDRGVRPEKERIPLSRRLSPNAADGSLFQAALEEARTIVDARIGNLLLVNSFNEWHEDTQIEPCVAVEKSQSSTNLPANLTFGLEYTGYEFLYLNMLKKETKAWKPVMVVPVPTTITASSVAVKIRPAGEILDADQEDIVTISDTIGYEVEME